MIIEIFVFPHAELEKEKALQMKGFFND